MYQPGKSPIADQIMRLKKQPGSPLRILQGLRGQGVNRPMSGGLEAPTQQPGLGQQTNDQATGQPQQTFSQPAQVGDSSGGWNTGRQESQLGGGSYANQGGWTGERTAPQVGTGAIGGTLNHGPMLQRTPMTRNFAGDPRIQQTSGQQIPPGANIQRGGQGLVAAGSGAHSDTGKNDQGPQESDYWSGNEGRQELMRRLETLGYKDVRIDANGDIYAIDPSGGGWDKIGNTHDDPSKWETHDGVRAGDAVNRPATLPPVVNGADLVDKQNAQQFSPFDANALQTDLDKNAAATRARYAKDSARAIRAAMEAGAYAGVGADQSAGTIGDIQSQGAIAAQQDIAKQNLAVKLHALQAEIQRALAAQQFDYAKQLQAQSAQAQAQLVRLQNDLSNQVGWNDVLGGLLNIGGFALGGYLNKP